MKGIAPQGANKSNLALLGYVSATGIMLGSLVWVFNGSNGKELSSSLIVSLVLSFLATGVILIRKKFDTIGKQLLAVFIFTALSIGLTILAKSLGLKNSNILASILPWSNIGGILSLVTLVILWFYEKIKTQFQIGFRDDSEN